MTLYEISKTLGGSFNSGWINIPGPGHSSNDRSLGFRFHAAAPDGILVYSFAGDDEALCRDHVQKLLAGIAAGQPLSIAGMGATSSETFKGVQSAAKLWSEGLAPGGTPVEAYLNSRHCLSTKHDSWKGAVRYHPFCPFGSFLLPAILALIRDALTGALQGVHRTALKPDGSGKHEMPDGMHAKMMMGKAAGGVIMLDLPAEHIGIAEGIETALSAQIVSGLPVWAVMSTGGMSNFPVLPSIQKLTVFADNDEPGLKAAVACGSRYAAAKVTEEILYPPNSGDDWNDYLQSLEAKK